MLKALKEKQVRAGGGGGGLLVKDFTLAATNSPASQLFTGLSRKNCLPERVELKGHHQDQVLLIEVSL